MDSEPGRSLIVWTIRFSVMLYAWSLFTFVKCRRRKQSTPHSDLLIWSGSWVACLVHVVFAFHFEHHWSHTEALQHTANVTASVTGLRWSIGLYVNYAFLAAWGGDVVRRWRNSAPATSIAFHVIAAFMMLNATAVFGPGFWIPVVMIYATGIWLLAYRLPSES
ncbi:MAG: hypothetical protein ABJZ55_08245 [Fuerstiella sp.]